MESVKPAVEVVVEGELSPFEHEALYKLLKKHFRLEQPTYSEISDETISTRVNITFHHSYDREFFTEIFKEDWRGLKELFKQISYRRAAPGAGFILSFVDGKTRLIFHIGTLGGEPLGSAMDQMAHLTGVVGQVISPQRMTEPLGLVEIVYDPRSDRWQWFRGVGLFDKKEYVFNEASFRWKPLLT
ncbi:MAG TPA: hypothetical protein VFE96_07160 [Candidatus Bathyarchaeia archaeon]|nr:hypothetical protein [Candidatus Bathyarchaeia archaeon]